MTRKDDNVQKVFRFSLIFTAVITASCSIFSPNIHRSVDVLENGDKVTAEYYIDNNGAKILHGEWKFISADGSETKITIYKNGKIEGYKTRSTYSREDVFPNMIIPDSEK